MASLKLIFSTALLYAQIFIFQNVNAQIAESTWSQEEMSLTIDSVNAILQKDYIFPEVSDKMVQSVKNNFAEGKYKSIANPAEFASRLTQDLQSISNDRHLRIVYNPSLISAERKTLTREERTKREDERGQEMKRENFGFQEIKILDGNIGYLDLRMFADPKYGGATAVAAMNFINNADAVIVDLRQNGGGSPGMIQLISSYFFPAEPVHLNSFYYRPTNKTTQTWTLPFVEGLRRPDIDVYVLTSSYTFSAAEEFSYNLKNLKRAILIGERTGGGAHPTSSAIATDRFFVRIPSGRAINPITNTNWEGTGVTPDIEVSAAQALITAQIKALEKLRDSTTDSSKARFYQWTLDGLKAKSNPVRVDPAILKSYVGKYGPGSITYEHGSLHYLREGGKFQLVAVTDDQFFIDGMNYFRIRFSKEADEINMIGSYQGGGTEKHSKH